MKKLSLLSLIVLLFASCATANTQKQSQGNNPFMTRTFKASSIKEVEASTAGGSLTLTGDAGSDATVEVYVSRDDWSAEKIKEALDKNYTIDIKVENGKLYAIANRKNGISNWNQQGLSISFKIKVPKQVTSKLKTSGGSIHIRNLSGSQDFQTSGGSLSVENTSGNTTGKTSGGSIRITGSKDNINLSTSGGSISAQDCSGKINLTTSGGSIDLSNLNGEISASTSGGSIKANDIKGILKTGTSGGSVNIESISGDLDAYTTGGSMNVKMTSVSNYVKLSNSGNLNLTLPASKGYNLNVKANKIDATGNKNFNGRLDNKKMEGTINGGGPEINVKSSQRIRLSFE